MFQIELKRINAAITAGRLDDAFESLQQTPLRRHFDGQRLTSRLVDRLLERAQSFLEDGFPREAKIDGHKAYQLAGQDERVIRLLKNADDQLAIENSLSQAKRGAASAAKIQAGLGQFTLGQKLLASEEHPQLFTEIARKREIAADAASRLQNAIDASDFDHALEVLQSLEPDVLRHRAVSETVRCVLQPFGERLIGEIRSGRFHQAAILGERLESFVDRDETIAEGKSTLDRCRRVANLIESDDYDAASREITLIEQLIGSCDWLETTKLALESIFNGVKDLRSSPLYLMSSEPVATRLHKPGRNRPAQPSILGKPVAVGDVASHLLRVDGVGAILLLDSDRVSIGSFSKSKQFDIPVQSDGTGEAIFIRRVGEDYFAESDSPFSINDRPLTQKLLASGDSISIGRRGRLKFRKPVPASGTATLQITGAGLPQREIRYVALMADSLLFAPSGGHFPLPHGAKPIVMYRGRSGYSIKYAGAGTSGKASGGSKDLYGSGPTARNPEPSSLQSQHLEVGHPIEISDVRFSLNSVVLS